jgi:hypothetical protein
MMTDERPGRFFENTVDPRLDHTIGIPDILLNMILNSFTILAG